MVTLHSPDRGTGVRPPKIGVALNPFRSTDDPRTLGWTELRDLAVQSEALGFDTVWVPDTLIGRFEPGGAIHGWWDAIALLAAIAASTSQIKLGSWVLASLYRDPGITAKQAATIDEISGGRFVLGIGAGAAGTASRAFGFGDDHVYERFEEALEILIPLLRAGRADFEGTYWRARELPQLPAGPRPGAIPILLAAHGPKGYRHAARVADIWSCYQLESGDAAELGPRVRALEAACAEVGRDPGSIGRSAGIVVAPLAREGETVMTPYGKAITGPAERIAESIRALAEVGFSQVELWPEPMTGDALEALAPHLAGRDANQRHGGHSG
jgi:alkanesulfonate monooxygenase SsuD/methylene tetrahydromethanopterin reductase-like flavin-dependent oxidoreductase (luciferase family)